RRAFSANARWTWWAITAGAALLAASQWLHAPSVEYLVPFLIATVATVVAAVLARGASRWGARISGAFLVTLAALSVPAQRDLWRVEHSWDRWRHETTVRALEALKQEIDAATRRSVVSARSALASANTTDASHAFDALSALVAPRDE